VLAPVVVHAIETVLDVVLAQAAEVMAAGSKTSAGIGHEVSERTELCRPTRVVEPPPAPNDRLVGQLAQ
jgi:hypothetical protein